MLRLPDGHGSILRLQSPDRVQPGRDRAQQESRLETSRQAGWPGLRAPGQQLAPQPSAKPAHALKQTPFLCRKGVDTFVYLYGTLKRQKPLYILHLY